ncbi:hypothetical protein H5410_024689 [Solanum commersonii]|uniref:Endonuclease/exonuclease/phosphatase domain-containing protein n=1 Tax=Solanum commersonii TaxID=4109 RepID=A0A9J5ZMQ0_SOLCO|nr:hypothetical protein H5410_024689 [Solanum commersonii]
MKDVLKIDPIPFTKSSSGFVGKKIKIGEVILRWVCGVMRLASKGGCFEFIELQLLWEISSSRNIEGQRKSAIIIPEMDYNVGWSDLANKIIDLWVSVNPAPRKNGGHELSVSFELENLQEYLRCCLVGTFNDHFHRVQIQRSSIGGSRKGGRWRQGLGPKNLRQPWANLKQRPNCSRRLQTKFMFFRMSSLLIQISNKLRTLGRKKGNLHLNKKKEILKEWKAIRPAQAQSIVAETQKLSERQSNAMLSQKPLLAPLTQIDSLDEWEGDVDDEIECMRPLSLLSLPPIHSVFSIGYSQDSERFDLWDELAAVRGIWDGCWVIGGDFNVCRYEHERYNCIRRSQDMKDFSEFIQDMGLIDLPLHGATYTWTRGEDFLQASRIDRFLISAEWNEFFGVVKQVALPRVLSDHSPLALESGDWTSDPSYFKFENMWLQHEGFHDMVKKWWQGYIVNGSPDFILSQKLKFLKKDLVTWNKEVFGKLNSRISKAIDDLLLTEQATEGRVRSQVEKNKILQLQLEIQQLAKAEETSWRQKSRCLWLKEGDRNTKYFQRIANSHKRYNHIDRLQVGDDLIEGKEQVKEVILDIYQELYSKANHGGLLLLLRAWAV